jgi:transcriptional regulator with XRE-family HTH domain
MGNIFNGPKLKEMRKKQNITQKELAEALDMAVITICRYETNQRIPDSNTLSKIVKKFNCEYGDLFI